MMGLCVKECEKYKEWTAQTYSASVCYLCWNDVLNSPCLFCTIASCGTGTSLTRAEGSDIWNNGLLSCGTIRCPSHHIYVWAQTRKHVRISGVDFLPVKYHWTPALGYQQSGSNRWQSWCRRVGLVWPQGGTFCSCVKTCHSKSRDNYRQACM